MIDKTFYKHADQDRLREILLDICNDNEQIVKQMNYLSERYKPEDCKDEMADLRKRLFSSTSLMVLLDDLREQIILSNMEQQAMNLCHTNSNYGEYPQSPDKKEVMNIEKM